MLEAGSIALLPVPFSDQSATKKRPVLLLTDPDAYGDFIAMPITSQARTAQHPPDQPSGYAGWEPQETELGTLRQAAFLASFHRRQGVRKNRYSHQNSGNPGAMSFDHAAC